MAANETKLCKCGCGEPAGKTFAYKRGHKPASGSKPANSRQTKPVGAPTVEPDQDAEAPETFVPIEFNAASLDRIWSMLPLHEKAVAIATAISVDRVEEANDEA